jgi:hypothetical protein
MRAGDSRRVSGISIFPVPFVLSFALLACSNAGTNEKGSGGTILSESGALSVTWECISSETPARARNRFELYIESTESELPADGLTLSMVPFMPAMGHGSSTVPEIDPMGRGKYEAADVVLAMPGVWELRTTISGAESDYAAPRVEID